MLRPMFKLQFVLATTLPLQVFNIKQSRKRLILKDLCLQLMFLRLILVYIANNKFKVSSPRLTRQLFMTTRAPYRYKLTRNQYMLARYNYTCLFEHPCPNTLPLRQAIFYTKVMEQTLQKLSFIHGSLSAIKLSLPCTVNLVL